jgi:hypothetical protein
MALAALGSDNNKTRKMMALRTIVFPNSLLITMPHARSAPAPTLLPLQLPNLREAAGPCNFSPVLHRRHLREKIRSRLGVERRGGETVCPTVEAVDYYQADALDRIDLGQLGAAFPRLAALQQTCAGKAAEAQYNTINSAVRMPLTITNPPITFQVSSSRRLACFPFHWRGSS